MLTQLFIENIAVIEKTDVSFSNGLNVLTGETGAGKSVVIDAISAILGHRTSKELIRTGCSKAYVSAVFSDVGANVIKKLREVGVDADDCEDLIISREISLTGKSTCRVNSRPVPVSLLREIGILLINIHGQHESYQLFSPGTHMDYIDNSADYGGLLAEYKEAFRELVTYKKQLDSLNEDESGRLREIDLLSYQVNEILFVSPEPGEEEQLEAERKILQNSERLSDCLMRAKICAEGEGDYEGALSLIDNICSYIRESAEYNPALSDLSDKLLDIYYNLQDCADEINSAFDEAVPDEGRLNEIEERLGLINKLKRKYGADINEILNYLSESQKRLEYLTDIDVNKDKLIALYDSSLKKTAALADKLTERRLESGREFISRVGDELKFLDMPNVKFTLSAEKTPLTSKGQDKIELLVSANLGEAPKPVAKIASGGELSRIMLAIKTVLSRGDTVGTLIFDEVDAGISGSAAQKVGLKLKQLSSSHQVICVTHQAQIAALANEHYLIKKTTDDNKTYTNITRLDNNGRVSELARIIDGVNITETALAHARQLLKSN